MTDLEGRQISRLGAHFDPIVAALAPLWRIWPNPSLLLVVQAVAVAAGAIPVFLLARKHLALGMGRARFRARLSALPGRREWLVVDDFHPVALATPLLLTGFWLLDEDRLLPFAFVGGLACLTKEHIGFTVAAMGLWYAHLAAAARGLVDRGRRGRRLADRDHGDRPAFRARRRLAVRVSLRGRRRLAVGDRQDGLHRSRHHARGDHRGRDLQYVFHLLLPLAFLSLLGPAWRSPRCRRSLLNLLSDVHTQTSIHFHYTAGAIPGLIVGADLRSRAPPRPRRRSPRRTLVRAVVAVSLVATVVYGPVPLWSHVPFGQKVGAVQYRITARNHAAAAAVRLIPADAPVSASNTWAPIFGAPPGLQLPDPRRRRAGSRSTRSG